MDLNALIIMSRKYGANPEFVLAGGGNTSYKEGGVMAVKASGSALSVIAEDGFVLMDVEKLRALAHEVYPDDDKAREACALKDMMAARLEGQDDMRPSVECILHALFHRSYVLHLHPALINGLTCGMDGAAAYADIFEDLGEPLLWVPLTKPGYTLSKTCAELFENHAEKHGRHPSVVLLQNHGIFAAADTTEEIDAIMEGVVECILKKTARRPELDAGGLAPPTGAYKAAIAPERLAGAAPPYDAGDPALPADARYAAAALEGLADGVALFLYNDEIARFTESREAYAPLMSPFSPDHIVYCRAYPMLADAQEEIADALDEYEKTYGGKPKIIAMRGLGVFALGKDKADARLAAELYIDAVKIAVYSESFGGPLTLPADFTDFIVNWESESYRQEKAGI